MCEQLQEVEKNQLDSQRQREVEIYENQISLRRLDVMIMELMVTMITCTESSFLWVNRNSQSPED